MKKRRRWVALLALLTVIAAACGDGDTEGTEDTGTTEAGAAVDVGTVVLFSTQANPPEEQDAIISDVFEPSGFDVEFIPEQEGPFVDRILAEAQAGDVQNDLLMALHGTYPSLIAGEALMDLSDVAADLAEVGIAEDFLELGKLGTDQQWYIPVFQATYMMAAHQDAMAYLPDGVDVNALTYDQLLEWAAAASEGEGRPVLGFPAGEEGLMHRFLQGYLYPSFTGGMVTGFDSPEAVDMWTYFSELWEHVSPQANTYAFMQEQLLAGDVLIAFDHQARLVDALDQSPEDFVVFPAPTGPAGLGFMPVLVGLAIPEGASNVDGAVALMEYLLSDEGQIGLTQAIGFFPVTEAEVPSDLGAAIQAEATAAADQTAAPDALPALLPVGLGDRGGEFNEAYRNAFLRIIFDQEDIASVLSSEGDRIQEILDSEEAPCWPPDPPSDGACQLNR
jgi:multiple sugar transport system substrate-binding protein